MSIQVTCPTCNGQFNAPDDAAGRKAKCPTCGGAIEIRQAAIGDEIVDAELAADRPLDGAHEIDVAYLPDAPEGSRKPCPMCGEMIQKDAIKCRFCGEIFDATLAKAERMRGSRGGPGETVEEAAKRLNAEKHDRTTAIQLFVTSIIGCFSPILVIYGIVFLVRRPYPFKYKGLAIAGTILHGFWALFLIASIVLSQSHH